MQIKFQKNAQQRLVKISKTYCTLMELWIISFQTDKWQRIFDKVASL